MDLSEEEAEAPRQATDKQIKVTMKVIDQWCAKLREKDSLVAIHAAVAAFKAAVQQSGGDATEKDSKYKVAGPAVFNAIVRMCITELYPALLRLLEIPAAASRASRDSKKTVNLNNKAKWKKVKLDVKSYLTDLLQLAGYIAEPGILNVLLKHIYQLVTFYAHFPKLVKNMIKTLVGIWSSGEETSRVLAFLSLNSVTRKLQDTFLEYVLKQLYMAYVKNCKFTSPTTLPLINFMQRSLVELFAIDTAVTYQYAFVYIRQLAIHLRNAITAKTTETAQAVYNWQFIHSLHLWTRLVCQLWPNQALEPLIYPLVQVILGTIKLIPSPRYYPLRFHCVKALNMLTESTGTFIPVLPILTEVLELTDFSKRSKSSSVKPFNFACILKLSKQELTDKAFKDGVMDNLYEHLLETFAIHSHTIGFPELALPAVLQLKSFLKSCKGQNNYSKVMKQLLEKVQETSKTITVRRKKATLALADSVAVGAWERRNREDGTPLSKHHAQYRRKRDAEQQREIADRGRDLISSEELPVVERRTKKEPPPKATAEERQEFKGLFASDSEPSSGEESENEERFLPKEERSKKGKVKGKKSATEEESSDEYSDLNEDEMAALDRSASEEDDDNDDDTDNSDDIDNNDDDVDEVEGSVSGSDPGDVVEDFTFSDDESE